MTNGGPNRDFLYLNDMIGPGDPHFEEMRDKYKGTPEGKRIEEFRTENEKFQDGLPAKTHASLDMLIRAEGVNYNGDSLDRIGKIRAIRKQRVDLEKEKLKSMSPEEKEVYLATGNENEAKRIAENRSRLEQEAAEQQARAAATQEKRTKLQEAQLERRKQREELQAKNRAFLDEQVEARGKINPVALKKAAEEARRKEEDEENQPADEEETAETGVQTGDETGQDAQDPNAQSDTQTGDETGQDAPVNTGDPTAVDQGAAPPAPVRKRRGVRQ